MKFTNRSFMRNLLWKVTREVGNLLHTKTPDSNTWTAQESCRTHEKSVATDSNALFKRYVLSLPFLIEEEEEAKREIAEREIRMASSEAAAAGGFVISCHNPDIWKQQFQQGVDSKKLVYFLVLSSSSILGISIFFINFSVFL